LRGVGFAFGILLAPGLLLSQNNARTLEVLAAARAQLPASPDSAVALLRAGLAVVPYIADSSTVHFWIGVAHFYAGRDSLARASFRQSMRLYSGLVVRNLEQVSPRLAELYESERASYRITLVGDSIDTQPALISGPAVVYPWSVWRRGVTGRARVRVVVDTTGHVEPDSIMILQVPDSGLVEPVRRMLLASTFAPGRLRGSPKRAGVMFGIELKPGPAPDAAALAGRARTLARRHPDSALALLAVALDSTATATEAERVYALLVRGIAWTANHNDSLARRALDTALEGYAALSARGTDLAPFLRRLADSVRLARRGGERAVATMVRLTVLGQVDEPPVLVSHPPVRYPPEMWKLKIGGTVTIEVTVDATGRVVPASVRVVQSPNHGLDAEAKRVVGGAVYRPARKAGQPASATIRQPITFAPY
jgi:TonB family protein